MIQVGSRPLRGRPVTENLEIRQANSGDAQGMSALIESLSHYRSPGAKSPAPAEFSAGYSADTIEKHLSVGSVRYFVAVLFGDLVGVIGLGEGPRVRHFFVAEGLHGQGIGRALWNRAAEDALSRIPIGRQTIIEVRSSVYAVPVYERFGFSVCGAAVEASGAIFVPMRATLGRPAHP